MAEEERLRHMEQQLSDIRVDMAGIKVEMKNLDTRLEKIEDTLKWIVRLVIGTPLGALALYLVKGGFGG